MRRLLLFLLLCSPVGAITRIQTFPATTCGSAPTTCTSSGSAIAAGDTVVVTVIIYDGTTNDAASVTDGGSTYVEATHIDNATATTFRTYVYYVCSAAGGGSSIVAHHASGTSNFIMVTGEEYSGLASSSCLDQTGTAQSTSSVTTITSTTGTTTVASELLVGGWGDWDGVTPVAGTDGAGGNYTLQGNNSFVALEDEIVSSTNTYDANMTFSATRPSIVFASFKTGAAPTQKGTVLAGPAKMAGPAVRHL